jgi:hypothetical protein
MKSIIFVILNAIISFFGLACGIAFCMSYDIKNMALLSIIPAITTIGFTIVGIKFTKKILN